MAAVTTWRELLDEAIAARDDSKSPFFVCSLTDEELDREFDDDFGCSEGKPFFAWTSQRVYFAAIYDGAEWVASVPRYPSDEEPKHVGGGDCR